MHEERTFTAFAGGRRIAAGNARELITQTMSYLAAASAGPEDDLRRALAAAGCPLPIVTVRGLGWMLVKEVAP